MSRNQKMSRLLSLLSISKIVLIIIGIVLTVLIFVFQKTEYVVTLSDFMQGTYNLVVSIWGVLGFVYFRLPSHSRPNPPKETISPHHSLQNWRAKVIVDHDQIVGYANHLHTLDTIFASIYNRVAVIHGEGGVGKTTLAYEHVNRNLEKLNICQIAWISSRASNNMRLLDEILEEILLQLGEVRITRRALIKSDFEKYIISQNQRIMIVVDNLETQEALEELLSYFIKISEQNAFIAFLFTSRVQPTKHNIAECFVTGFKHNGVVDQQQVCAYIESLSHGIMLENRSDKLINLVSDKSDGNPFIIKFIIKTLQRQRRTIDEVIAGLESANLDIKKHLFDTALGQLRTKYNINADNIMKAFCIIPPGQNYQRDELFEATQISDKNTFDNIVADACSLYLIRALNFNEYFTVHSLLRQYICTERQVM